MRVLHIFNEINFSGAEIMYANAANLFQSEDIDMIALSTGANIGNFTKQFDDAKIKIFHRPLLDSEKNPLSVFRYFKGIVNFIKTENIDVIHIHRSTFFWFFAFCGYITGIRTVRTLHNVFKSGRITWWKAYLERMSARKILNVKFQSIGQSVYLNELKYYKNPSTIVNNWVDGTKFYPAINESEKLKIRLELGIDKDSLIIVTAGRCTEEKCHNDIIRALSIINDKISCVFLHLGCGVLEQDEKTLTDELNLNHKVFFLGNKINVRDYLIASDIFVMTSKFEGLSIASIEAMSCQLPLILYNSPGLRDLINNDDNGFLIAHDYKLLADAVLKYYYDKLLIVEKSLNAQDFVNKNFSMEVGVRGIIHLYGK